MYRLSRFYVSDIVAGTNIIRNSFFPIINKGDDSDHGIIVAANGSCKTTLLSFLFSVFCPDQRRFVQHLQSEGDKTMDQYLIPGRPGIVLLDLITREDPSLFEEEPWSHIILGQLFYRRKTSPSKVERVSFLTHDPMFIDKLSKEWSAIVDSEEPYNSAKKYIFPMVDKFSSHREWEEKLEDLCLDPWLINRQVDFARREGGIKDAFKFKNESEFLSFFLGCVIDIDYTAKIRQRVLESVDKMKNRPVKKAELESVNEIKSNLSEFNEHAAVWRDLKSGIKGKSLELGKAAYLLEKGLKSADTELSQKTNDLFSKEKLRKSLKKEKDSVFVNRLYAKSVVDKIEISDLDKNSKDINDKISFSRKEISSLKVAGFKAEFNRISAEIDNIENILSESTKELTGERNLVNKRAYQYYTRLEKNRKDLFSEIEDLKTKEREAEKEKNSLKSILSTLLKEKEALNSKLIKITNKKENAEKSLKALNLYEGESVEDAKKRLGLSLENIEKKIAEFKDFIKEEKRNIELTRQKIADLNELLINSKHLLNNLNSKISKEKEAYEDLVKDANIASIVGANKFDPFDDDVLTRLGLAKTRKNSKIENISGEIFVRSKELESLEAVGSIAVEEHVFSLINYYIENKIEKNSILPFPEYLSSAYENPDETAEFLKKDPARFTGIMCKNEDVLEKIKNIPVPEWLLKPVVVSVPCSILDVAENRNYVAAPANSYVYSKSYANKKKDLLTSEIASLEEKRKKENKELNSIRVSESKIENYRKNYSNDNCAASLVRELEACKLRIEDTSQNIEENKNLILSVNKKIESYEGSMGNLNEQYTQNKIDLDKVKTWIANFNDLKFIGKEALEIQAELSKMSSDVLEKEEKVQSLSQFLESLISQTARKESEYETLNETGLRVVKPDAGYIPSKDIEKEAFSLSLNTLEQLYHEAVELEKTKASDLGIQTLKENLEELKKKYQEYEYDMEAFILNNDYSEELSEVWASKEKKQRLERLSEIELDIDKLMEEKGSVKALLDQKKSEYKLSCKDLEKTEKKGLKAEIDIDEKSKDEVLNIIADLEKSEKDIFHEIIRMEKEISDTQQVIEKIKEWQSDVKVSAAKVSDYEPVAEPFTSDVTWPDLTDEKNRTRSLKSFILILDEIKNRIKVNLRSEGNLRKRLTDKFDRFQAKLMEERFLKYLPVIVGELRNYDLESLGEQSGDLINQCDNIAKNIEGDLQRTEEFMKSLIDMMMDHARDCYRKLEDASKIVMPDSVFIHGGKPILKTGYKLDFAKYQEDFEKTIDSWLHELIAENRIPQVNPKAGNELGTEMLYRLLMAARAKKEFNIKLLKCDDTGKNYEPVGKDLGSGGEALTTAVLLYSLLTSMRQERKGNKEDKIPAFLISDNPLGVCNRSDFLDVQLKMANSLGIQCVYFTGINDAESINLFPHRIAIRKAGRQVEIGKRVYNLLEIIEQSIEKAQA